MGNTRNRNQPADPLAAAVAELKAHVRPGDRLVAALSGGVDSVLLLHLLHGLAEELGCALSALHVHHGLSPNADRWQAFCEELCHARGIPLTVRRVSVRRDDPDGLEAAARRARYAAFSACEAEFLVLAHHRDDQAETLLLNLLRGAGVAGAAAMPTVRPFNPAAGPRILRPFLDLPRETILAHARAQGLDWIEDESNADPRHARNFLRHRILPLLEGRFPGCNAVLSRAAAHFAEAGSLLDDLARLDSEAAMEDGRLVVSRLAALAPARARNLLRHVLRREGVRLPDSAYLEEMLRQIVHAAPDSQPRFDFGDRAAHVWRNRLWLVTAAAPVEEVEWHGQAGVCWGGLDLHFERVEGRGIGLDRLAGQKVRIAPRRGGERLRPDFRRPRRSLKKLLQEQAIPPWARGRLPLLWCGEELVWVAGIGIDSEWQCRPGKAGLMPRIEGIAAA